VPSFSLKVGDVVQLRATSKMAPARGRQRERRPRQLPAVARDRRRTQAWVHRSLPLREDIQIPCREQLIVELYSK
jgi:small subunit ribosomal protein S4